MGRYLFEVAALVEVEAPNIMQAARRMQRLRVVGSGVGGFRNKNERDYNQWSAEAMPERRIFRGRLPARQQDKGSREG
jgi:hypothetical protein